MTDDTIGPSHTPPLRGRTPSATAGMHVHAAQPRDTVSAGRPRLVVVLVSVTCVLAGVALLLVVIAGGHSPAQSTAPGQDGNALAQVTINSGVAVVPRTVAQTATSEGLQLTLVATPALPGYNTFTLRLRGERNSAAAVQVRLSAVMVGMHMQPLAIAATEHATGEYQATALLSMFGHWRITARVATAGQAPASHVFDLSLDLPRGA